MHSKLLPLAVLAAGAIAQNSTMNLTAALTSAPTLSNLTSYVSLLPSLLASLSSASNITILAPSDDAFATFMSSPAAAAIATNDTDAIQALLSYHVLNGTYPASAIMDMPAFVPTLLNNSAYANVTGGQVVEAVTQGMAVEIYSGLLANSTVTQADVPFTGGIIHIINTVLTLPQNISSTAVAAGLTAAAGALTKANLATALDEMADVTVFVPSNDAFNAIGSATANLSVMELASVLQYHVVNGTVAYSSTLMNGTMVPTLGGANLTITLDGSNVFVNSAKVITPNVLVANGVVHVIDNVLNPAATTATPVPSASTQTPAFAGASSVSENPLTSGIPAPTSTIGAGPTMGTGMQSSSMSAGGAAATSAVPGGAVRMGGMGTAGLVVGVVVWGVVGML
ncbi:hypothetical protein MMC21_000921 [Puttea exsequens]|nr:hypothetical protein [Puttea exsequens]